jgi:hypothetical protein
MPFPYITRKKFHLKIWESISEKYFEHIERWHKIIGQNKWIFCKALGDFSWLGQLPNNVLMRVGDSIGVNTHKKMDLTIIYPWFILFFTKWSM